MPSGKANFSNIFCRRANVWCEAFSIRIYEKFKILIIFESNIVDCFGGPNGSKTGAKTYKQKAELLCENVVTLGELTGDIMHIDK